MKKIITLLFCVMMVIGMMASCNNGEYITDWDSKVSEDEKRLYAIDADTKYSSEQDLLKKYEFYDKDEGLKGIADQIGSLLNGDDED